MTGHLPMLPKDKHDVPAVARLAAVGFPAISPALPGLIEWLKDMNWPVARPIADLLVDIGAPVVPHLLEVLEGEDAIWKYWCLECVARRLPSEAIAELRPALERLAWSPSQAELLEEVDVSAKALLYGI